MEAKLLRITSTAIPTHRKISRIPRKLLAHRRCRQDCTFQFLISSCSAMHAIPSAQPLPNWRMGMKSRVDETGNYTLEGVRISLVRLEDSIISGLVERAQYRYNPDTYDPNAFVMEGFHGSLVEYIVKETEKIHAKVGRYSDPDEHPFFPLELPEPLLPPLQHPQVLHPNGALVNINAEIWDMYFKKLLPRLVEEGDDGNCGSTAVCDSFCLQVLSKRIHYGKFVAEAKFQASPDLYKAAIRAKDRNRLMQLLTCPEVEELVKKRVEMKVREHFQEVTIDMEGESKSDPKYKINPIFVANLYGDWVMPLTKEVEVEYLLRRLD
nr:chorismate mutase 1, chloroplastic [Ipomoea batatas]GMC73555.1 chorismate mutase 1, chloroplastic [Ipomoea batatas]